MANKYGETPLHRAKTALKQKLSEKAIKLGQAMDILPFKEDAKKKKRASEFVREVYFNTCLTKLVYFI